MTKVIETMIKKNLMMIITKIIKTKIYNDYIYEVDKKVNN